jgi:hypothetical protein
VLASVTQNAGADFIILQDGSTSMRVSDARPDRWQRSVSWIRMFAELLSWQDQRIALALFAHRTAPQVRLTKDPNALFFFLDHLGDEPPFRLEADTSWDTNIEESLYWGVKMFERDEELYGVRLSSKAFIVISDGQDWSGDVEEALKLTRMHDIRVYVVGVGSTAGGFIPQLPTSIYAEPEDPIHSALDRRSIRTRTSRCASSPTCNAVRRRLSARRRSLSCTGSSWPRPRDWSASEPCLWRNAPSCGGRSPRRVGWSCGCCSDSHTSVRRASARCSRSSRPSP